MAFPDAEGLRPSPDRVRETVFNWLMPDLPGARCLDLFAGSGILGFEALSRGAASVVAVDSGRRVAAALRDAAAGLGAGPEQFEVVAMEADAFLRRPRGGPFDLVYVDPPHATADYNALCAGLEAGGLLAPDALVYLEFATGRAASFSPPGGWNRYRTSRAGGLTYQLWRRASQIDPASEGL